jgi:hypothetical protein
VQKLLLLVGAILVAGALTPAALAAKPSIGPVSPSNFDFAAGDLCPFGVSIRTVETKQFILTYSEGHAVTHGSFVVSVTNTDTGFTRYFNLPGSFTFDFLPNGIVRATGTGPTLSYFPTGAFLDNRPGSLIFTTGRTVEVDDFSGAPFVVSFDVLSGTSENLCVSMA